MQIEDVGKGTLHWTKIHGGQVSQWANGQGFTTTAKTVANPLTPTVVDSGDDV